MPGNATVSSRGMSRSLFIWKPSYGYYLSLSTIETLNYTVRDAPLRRRPAPRLAADREVLLRAAGAPAARRRRVRPVARPVPRAAPARARRAASNGTPGGDAGVRRVQRHRPRRPAREPRA